MLRTAIMSIMLTLLGGCFTVKQHPALDRLALCQEANCKKEVVVDYSAAGWNVKLGVDLQTVLVNSQGQEFDVGKTQYPDINPAHLLKCRVEELKADFLVLHIRPVASGGSTLTVFTILPDDIPVRAADIQHHWETLDNPRETLFTDSDGDGMPELRDWAAYRWHGTNTYYSFDGRQFHPQWVDYYEAPADDDSNMRFVSRTKAH